MLADTMTIGTNSDENGSSNAVISLAVTLDGTNEGGASRPLMFRYFEPVVLQSVSPKVISAGAGDLDYQIKNP